MSLFCTNYDIVIVGGGISGLFVAYKLCETNLNILLIEKSSSLGGRIHTIYNKKDDVQYECAAARFNENHHKLLSLVHELNLESKMYTLSKDIDTITRKYQTHHKLNLNYLFDVLKKTYKKYPRSYLQNINLYQILVEIFDNETAEFIKDSFGYDSEFIHLNADAALIMFEHDLFSNNDYYILKGGLSEIIFKMEQFLKNKSNITILKNNTLKKILNDKIETSIDTYYYKRLILAIPQFNLKQLDEFKDFKLLDSVKPIHLLRIYATYPVDKDGPWFKDIKRTTTNNYLRHIIPVDYKKGLIMISYTDSLSADMLANMYQNSKKSLEEAIHKEIKTIFKINPPDMINMYVHDWNHEYTGVHMWKPGEDILNLYEKILQPDLNKEIYICGEAYSKKQCWIEGALQTSYDVIKRLHLEDIFIEISNPEDDIVITEEINDPKIHIDKVLQNKTWIAIEFGSIVKVYDIKDWISDHPGGNIILEGIKANNYYKDGTGKSPIEMIRNIGEYHYKSVKRNLLNNKNIKYLGLLDY